MATPQSQPWARGGWAKNSMSRTNHDPTDRPMGKLRAKTTWNILIWSLTTADVVEVLFIDVPRLARFDESRLSGMCV